MIVGAISLSRCLLDALQVAHELVVLALLILALERRFRWKETPLDP